MLYYSLLVLLVALIAGALGFGFVAFAAAGIARICFFLFLVMFVVSLIIHRGRTSRISGDVEHPMRCSVTGRTVGPAPYRPAPAVTTDGAAILSCSSWA